MDVDKMRVPGSEGVDAAKALSKDAKILMAHVLEEIEDDKFEAIIQVAKMYYPYLWTYASDNQIRIDTLLMREAYLQGILDGVRRERARRRARASA